MLLFIGCEVDGGDGFFRARATYLTCLIKWYEICECMKKRAGVAVSESWQLVGWTARRVFSFRVGKENYFCNLFRVVTTLWPTVN